MFGNRAVWLQMGMRPFDDPDSPPMRNPKGLGVGRFAILTPTNLPDAAKRRIAADHSGVASGLPLPDPVQNWSPTSTGAHPFPVWFPAGAFDHTMCEYRPDATYVVYAFYRINNPQDDLQRRAIVIAKHLPNGSMSVVASTNRGVSTLLNGYPSIMTPRPLDHLWVKLDGQRRRLVVVPAGGNTELLPLRRPILVQGLEDLDYVPLGNWTTESPRGHEKAHTGDDTSSLSGYTDNVDEYYAGPYRSWTPLCASTYSVQHSLAHRVRFDVASSWNSFVPSFPMLVDLAHGSLDPDDDYRFSLDGIIETSSNADQQEDTYLHNEDYTSGSETVPTLRSSRRTRVSFDLTPRPIRYSRMGNAWAVIYARVYNYQWQDWCQSVSLVKSSYYIAPFQFEYRTNYARAINLTNPPEMNFGEGRFSPLGIERYLAGELATSPMPQLNPAGRQFAGAPGWQPAVPTNVRLADEKIVVKTSGGFQREWPYSYGEGWKPNLVEVIPGTTDILLAENYDLGADYREHAAGLTRLKNTGGGSTTTSAAAGGTGVSIISSRVGAAAFIGDAPLRAVNISGSWSVGTSTPLGNGLHALTATLASTSGGSISCGKLDTTNADRVAIAAFGFQSPVNTANNLNSPTAVFGSPEVTVSAGNTMPAVAAGRHVLGVLVDVQEEPHYREWREPGNGAPSGAGVIDWPDGRKCEWLATCACVGPHAGETWSDSAPWQTPVAIRASFGVTGTQLWNAATSSGQRSIASRLRRLRADGSVVWSIPCGLVDDLGVSQHMVVGDFGYVAEMRRVKPWLGPDDQPRSPFFQGGGVLDLQTGRFHAHAFPGDTDDPNRLQAWENAVQPQVASRVYFADDQTSQIAGRSPLV